MYFIFLKRLYNINLVSTKYAVLAYLNVLCCTQLTAWGREFLFFSFFGKNVFFFFQLSYSTTSEEMVSEDDYEIWILPQELQSVDINLQSFWSNWCSAEEECNTSCCDVPCILFSTVSGHACHSSLQGCVGTISWPCTVNLLKLNRGRLCMSGRKKMSAKKYVL